MDISKVPGLKTPDQWLSVSTNTWHDFFLESQNKLRDEYGLELTLIEKVRLKNIVIQCYDEQVRVNGQPNDRFFGFTVHSEATVRFLTDCYGITYTGITRGLAEFTQEEIYSYMNRLQERAHLP